VIQPLPYDLSLDGDADDEDPRAPTSTAWQRLSPDARARVVERLPALVPEALMPPEGDDHRVAKSLAVDALDGFFRRVGRKVYLSSELAVFYPGERRFAPDVLAVLDVATHPRDKWVVDAEGRGLDVVLEVHYGGDASKDYVLNVERYARLGIREYFVFDRKRLRLHGYRLPAQVTNATNATSAARVYERIVPQGGRLASTVLGLDLALDGDKLRFWAGNAQLEESAEMIARLDGLLDKVITHKEEAEQRLEEQRAHAEEQRARAEALLAELANERQEREAMAKRLSELEAELSRREK
jgi:Uma2 family endonuclease